MNNKLHIISTPLLFILISCGGGSSDNTIIQDSTTTEPYTVNPVPGLGAPVDGKHFMAFISFERWNVQDLFFSASFFSTEATPYIGMIALDTCIAVTTPAKVLDDGEAESLSISAGEQIIISTSAGTYATIDEEISSTGRHSYSESFPNGLPASEQSSVDILGRDFPAFSNITVPTIQPLELLHPTATDEVSVNTVFRWVPDSDPDSLIALYGYGDTNFSCHVRDDGKFTLPVEFVAHLNDELDFRSGSISRTKYDFIAVGAAAVQISHGSIGGYWDTLQQIGLIDFSHK